MQGRPTRTPSRPRPPALREARTHRAASRAPGPRAVRSVWGAGRLAERVPPRVWAARGGVPRAVPRAEVSQHQSGTGEPWSGPQCACVCQGAWTRRSRGAGFAARDLHGRRGPLCLAVASRPARWRAPLSPPPGAFIAGLGDAVGLFPSLVSLRGFLASVLVKPFQSRAVCFQWAL